MDQSHVLKGDKCIKCGIKWSGLTEADINMLTTVGFCLGRVENWVQCNRYRGQFCLGDKHEECRDE